MSQTTSLSDLDESIKTNFENDKHRMLANLVFTSNWLRNNFNAFIAPYGLSFQQFNILRILRGNGDWMSMNDIKRVMIDKSPHTTRMVTKLLEKNLVDRKRSSKDRRVIYVTITKKGLALLKKLDVESKGQNSFLDQITEAEAQQVNSILDKLRQ